jgi:hypothetical protein
MRCANDDFLGAVAADLAFTEAIGAELAGTDKPLVNTRGTLALSGITGCPGSTVLMCASF